MTLLALRKNFHVFSKDIKLSHSLFSFPFVGASLIIAGIKLDISSLLLILISLTCARSFAMGMNRYFDREIDKKNPRTRSRALPSERMSSLSLLFISLGFGGLFVLSSTFYNQITFYCSIPVLIILGLYPFTKKWTSFCHLYLGFCLALSPIAASLALIGTVPLSSFFIAFSLLTWVGAFDIIYATQDYEFDKSENVYSLPRKLGIKKALLVSQILFVLMMTSLIYLGWMNGTGRFYWLGLIIMASILFYEHYTLSKKDDFSHIDPIFFTANAWVSVIYLAFVIFDKMMR